MCPSRGADHLTGLVPVLERYHVGLVFDTGFSSEAPTYAQWRELLDEKQIPVYDSAVEPMTLSGTDERGTIEIITDGRDFWVEPKH